MPQVVTELIINKKSRVLAAFLILLLSFFHAPSAYAYEYNLLTQTQHFDSIILSTDGPASNPKVATKNPAAPYGISTIKLNRVGGHLPLYSLSDLQHITFDYLLSQGDVSGDALEIHFYASQDNYSTKHLVRLVFADMVGSIPVNQWLSFPNSVSSQSNDLIWREITWGYPDAGEAWWQIAARYPDSRIDAVVLSLENPSSNYLLDNWKVNGDTWSVPDFESTPTSTPEPFFTPQPTVTSVPQPSLTPTPIHTCPLSPLWNLIPTPKLSLPPIPKISPLPTLKPLAPVHSSLCISFKLFCF